MNNSQCFFGDRLKKLRKEFGLTQSDLSKKIGIVRTAISNYETNRTMPDPHTLDQLAHLFDVSTDYLLGRVDNYSENDDLMAIFSQNLLNALEKASMTQKELAEQTNITPATISRYISGQRSPSAYNAKKISEVLGIAVDELLDTSLISTVKALPSFKSPLTKKDEKDIAKKLEEILDSMNSNEELLLYNNSLDDETRELIIASIERTLRQAKLIAKAKYTPTKYRK